MIPAGYLLKRLVPPPEWLVASPSHIREVCSVSGCVNEDLADPRETWKHNSFGLANDPALLWSLAQAAEVDLSRAELLFCTAFEEELESDGWRFDPAQWRPRTPDPSASIRDDIAWPKEPLQLLGYDVVSGDYGAVHSPLSCNRVAGEIAVNEHCLLDDFETAKEAIDAGRFGGGCEPGNYSIFAVYRMERP